MIKLELTKREFKQVSVSLLNELRDAITDKDEEFWAKLINKVNKQYEAQKEKVK